MRSIDFGVRRLDDWFAAIRRTRRAYRTAHRRRCRLLRPRRYTEKVQWRKLFELDPRFAILSDKIAVREFIAQRVGAELLPPLLWAGYDPDAVPLDTLERPFIVKGTHASGHTLRVHLPDVDVDAARDQFRSWLRHNHAVLHHEPAYGFVKPGLIVERLLQHSDGTPPVERKIWVFHGRVRFVQTIHLVGTKTSHTAFHDREWRRQPFFIHTPPIAEDLPRPAHLDWIIDVAERLGADFDHVRVDLYDTGDRIWTGEMTCYPYSGLVHFQPDEADHVMGSYWQVDRPLRRALNAIWHQRFEIRPPSDEAAQL
jgi:teichuronopeptide biosynthesis TupA-like protein